MAEGNVLVISNDPSLSYHAKKDLVLHDISAAVEADEAAGLGAAKSGNFDVVVFSVKEEQLEESRLLAELKNSKLDALLIAVTDNYTSGSISDMQALGVFDFLPAAFEPKNLFLTVKRAITVKKLKNTARIHEERIKTLEKQAALLNKKVEGGVKSTVSLYHDLQEAYMRLIKALAQTIDMRDKYTASHSANVARYASAVAEEMGLSLQEIKDIRDACELHDIGKIGIEDAILVKRGGLNDEEWRKMREHPAKGAQILQHLNLKYVGELVKQHHEHYDGSGYPEGKKGDEISLGARIIGLADAYDAMVSERSYKERCLSRQEAIEEIKKNSGVQFDPQIVDIFLRILDKVGK